MSQCIGWARGDGSWSFPTIECISPTETRELVACSLGMVAYFGWKMCSDTSHVQYLHGHGRVRDSARSWLEEMAIQVSHESISEFSYLGVLL